MSSTDELLKKLNELYLKRGYMDKYGNDLWITIILCLIFIYFIFREHIHNVLDGIKKDWHNQKCNPLYMPFAGYINKPKNQTNFEFTSNNFTGCIHSILQYISANAFLPFQLILKVLSDAIQKLLESFNMLRGLLDRLRSQFESIFGNMYAAMTNFAAAFIGFMVKIKDSMEKANGLLVTSFYVLYSAFLTMQSLFLSILDLLTLILIIIAAIIIVFICVATGLFPIPFVGPAISTPFIISAVATVVIMILILIPTVMFMLMMMRVLNLSSPPPPNVPSCFAGDTMIPLFAGGGKKIKDICIGDKLKDGGIVTATLQCSADGQNLYLLNGVWVTGEHRVFHPTLKWIKVKEHPNSIYMPVFDESYVYCLNTDTKKFIIGNMIYSDWDDIDVKVLKDLQHNCVSHGYLPENFKYADIHKYLESGFHPNSVVRLNSGLVIPINEVKVNDILENNSKVLGVIKIQGNVELYKHSFANNHFIYGTKNIHINDENLGIINCMKNDSECISSSVSSVPILYHLLTDSKYININDVNVNDYNYGIDKYLI
jgi:hypothetical protein